MSEISQNFSTSVMWRNLKSPDMWRNFWLLHICHVEKCTINPHVDPYLSCTGIGNFSTWQILWCPWQISGKQPPPHPSPPDPEPPVWILHQCDDHQFDNLINQFNNHLMESCGNQLGVDLFLIVVNWLLTQSWAVFGIIIFGWHGASRPCWQWHVLQ